MNIIESIEFVKEKHKGQTRKQGTPYYLHPVAVCRILYNKGFSDKYLKTALFHDLLEDTSTTYEELVNISSEEIAYCTKLLTKEKGYVMEQYINRIKNKDVAKMVKLADRLHNLSEAYEADENFQNKYIKETKEWYLDLAKDTVFEEDINREYNKLINMQKEREGR